MRAIVIAALMVWAMGAQGGFAAADKPLAGEDVVFEERGGVIAVEAEHYFKQERTDVRQWHLTTKAKTPKVEPDADPPHVAGASGGAYLEILPDTRRNHDEKLIKGENFSDEPGQLGVLSYKVHFNTPGRYYVWARILSSGTEDNGLHVGIDGAWPPSGQRMQWTGKNKWVWDSKQRTAEVHTGVPYLLYLDVEKPGPHTIQFSMREDGIEFDKWLMTTDRTYKPEGAGPAPVVREGKAPAPFEEVAAPDVEKAK